MGWPRTNEEMRIYRDKDKSFMFLWTEDRCPGGQYEAVANVLKGSRPSLGSCSVSPGYLAENRIKRVQWDEVPPEWQSAIAQWFSDWDPPFDPAAIRGFWRVGNQPNRRKK